MKPGYKTTEFWLTLALDAAIVVSAIESVLPPKWAAVAGAVANGLYAVSRGKAKSPTPGN